MFNLTSKERVTIVSIGIYLTQMILQIILHVVGLNFLTTICPVYVIFYLLLSLHEIF